MDSPDRLPLKPHILSSPTYDQEVDNLSQEELTAFDALDAQLSQKSIASRDESSDLVTVLAERSDEDNPFAGSSGAISLSTGFTSAFQLAPNMFSALEPDTLSSPSDARAESCALKFGAPPASTFTSPQPLFSLAPLAVGQLDAMSTGFMKASKRSIIQPSATALENARKRMRLWEQDDENTSATVGHDEGKQPNSIAGTTSQSVSPSKRPAFQPLHNSPSTPSPAGFIRPTITQEPSKDNAKPFRSPLIRAQVPLSNKPLSTHLAAGSKTSSKPTSRFGFATAATQHREPPAASPSPFATPSRPAFARGHIPSKFVTPFKKGFKGGPEKMPLREPSRDPKPNPPAPQSPLLPGQTPTQSNKVFDLTPRPHRQTLLSSGLYPQWHSSNELSDVNITDLGQMTPRNAIFYSFHATPDSGVLRSTSELLGPREAFTELLRRRCDLVTQPWVDNHWCLILWKLAGMVMLDPEKEGDPSTRRWTWREVIRQLLYRYERELNSGSRPPLRLISTQDSPASFPMILCVSGITWAEPEPGQDPEREAHPELEITDGWYRLRAQVDEPLARAIRRGVIRTGRKIIVAGAKLSSERKDPVEILEAYNSVKLILSGNSSHMAPWHAKLGFQPGPFISTLNSLTPDGGSVFAMDLVVIKIYPIAFIEFIEDDDGNQIREGPHSEKDEDAAADKWRRRRELEASKLRVELDKKLSRYEGYADRLERKAAGRFTPNEDDGPPDHIDDLYDELEYPTSASTVLSRVTSTEAGWLSRLIRSNVLKEREQFADGVERELDSVCPPRNVRNFRILIVQDACTRRRPANRTAQLTVWDVLSLNPMEGGRAGSFEIGQRYVVTNLVPTQQSAWMDREPGSEVFMSTRRDSRWRKMTAR